MKLKYRVMERFRGKYSVEAMCRSFEVSRSGYYAWRGRQTKEAKDQLVDGLDHGLSENLQTDLRLPPGAPLVRKGVDRRGAKGFLAGAFWKRRRQNPLRPAVAPGRP